MKKTKVTQACNTFFNTASHIDNFFSYIVFMTKRADEMRLHAVKTLAEINDTKPDPEDMKEVAMNQLNKYIGLLLEMWLCRSVECYQNYLSSILEDVFNNCPNALNSSETIKVEDVLKYNNMEDFIKELSEKKVSALSYSSFDDLYNFFDKKLGLKIIDDENKALIREAIETRNISIHNGCIINRRYVSKLDIDEKLIGSKKKIKKDFLGDVIKIMYDNVIDIDKKIIKKFKIKNCKPLVLEKEE